MHTLHHYFSRMDVSIAAVLLIEASHRSDLWAWTYRFQIPASNCSARLSFYGRRYFQICYQLLSWCSQIPEIGALTFQWETAIGKIHSSLIILESYMHIIYFLALLLSLSKKVYVFYLKWWHGMFTKSVFT